MGDFEQSLRDQFGSERNQRIAALEADLAAARAEITDLLPRMEADALTISNLVRELATERTARREAEQDRDSAQRVFDAAMRDFYAERAKRLEAEATAAAGHEANMLLDRKINELLSRGVRLETKLSAAEAREAALRARLVVLTTGNASDFGATGNDVLLALQRYARAALASPAVERIQALEKADANLAVDDHMEQLEVEVEKLRDRVHALEALAEAVGDWVAAYDSDEGRFYGEQTMREVEAAGAVREAYDAVQKVKGQ